MATYCGTADCVLVSRDWTALTGTDASDYLAKASERIDAEVNDWREPVAPLSSGGSTYDFWIKEACANMAVYYAYDSVMRDKYEATETPYWQRYEDRALHILGSLRANYSTMTEDTSLWERGIAPAIGVANGTVSAPYAGVCISNYDRPGAVYTANDDMPRTFLIELDGSGTSIYAQTYRWKYKGGTAWEYEDQSITPDSWHYLYYGVAVSWPSEADADVETGMRWEVSCYPARGGYKGRGVRSWSMVRG